MYRAGLLLWRNSPIPDQVFYCCINFTYMQTHTHKHRAGLPCRSDQLVADYRNYTTHKKPMPSAVFEPAIPAFERPQTFVLKSVRPPVSSCTTIELHKNSLSVVEISNVVKCSYGALSTPHLLSGVSQSIGGCICNGWAFLHLSAPVSWRYVWFNRCTKLWGTLAKCFSMTEIQPSPKLDIFFRLVHAKFREIIWKYIL